MKKAVVRVVAIIMAALMLLSVAAIAISVFADSATPSVQTGDTDGTWVIILFGVAFVAVIAMVVIGIIMKKNKK